MTIPSYSFLLLGLKTFKTFADGVQIVWGMLGLPILKFPAFSAFYFIKLHTENFPLILVVR